MQIIRDVIQLQEIDKRMDRNSFHRIQEYRQENISICIIPDNVRMPEIVIV